MGSSSSVGQQKWRRVQIRHILFQIAYDELPPIGRAIRMRCSHKNCINPDHMRVAGWEPKYRSVHKMIDREWLTREQAAEWFAGEQTAEQVVEEASKTNNTEAAPEKQQKLPSWETLYPAR
jgi:hypothetical protein